MSLCSNELSGSTGSTSRPKDEGVESHAGNAGEASGVNARQISQTTDSVIGSDNSLEDNEFEIVRATSRFELRVSHEKPRGERCSGKESCPACALLYALRIAQGRCAAAINMTMRAYYAADSKLFDDYIKRHGERPRGKSWPFPVLNSYQMIRVSYPDLASGIAATLSRKAVKKWKKTRFDVLVRNSCNPAYFRDTMPIPIRKSDVRLRKIGHDWQLRFSLTSGRHLNGTEYTIQIVPRDDFQRESLDKISSGEWRIGEVALQPDARRRGKWYARIAFKRKIVVVPRTERVGAINRGIICSIAAVTWDDDFFIDDGYDIEAYLKRCQRYRKQYQYSYALSQRKGKGRKRALRPINRLSGKAERWRETRLQATARRFALWFAAKGVATVYIEDFSDIRNGAPEKLAGGKMVWNRIQEWPYYQLGTRLRSCLEEEGIRTIDVPLQNFSNTCPWCGHTEDKKPAVLGGRTFRCNSCNKRVHYDVMQSMNVMARGIKFERSGGETALEKSCGDMCDKDARNGVTLEKSEKEQGQKTTARKHRRK